MKTRSGFVSNSSSSSFVICAPSSQIQNALVQLDEELGAGWGDFISSTFFRDGTPIDFNGSEYIRYLGISYTDSWDWPRSIPQPEDGYDSEELQRKAVLRFFELTGPVSHYSDF